mmetsp:Transcript_4174/g.8934  ORF Transcript_4174/g.8934 Transcript_4174/m.8934 type:complete len:475 (-) Transcript_4174:348-1772(-)
MPCLDARSPAQQQQLAMAELQDVEDFRRVEFSRASTSHLIVVGNRDEDKIHLIRTLFPSFRSTDLPTVTADAVHAIDGIRDNEWAVYDVPHVPNAHNTIELLSRDKRHRVCILVLVPPDQEEAFREYRQKNLNIADAMETVRPGDRVRQLILQRCEERARVVPYPPALDEDDPDFVLFLRALHFNSTFFTEEEVRQFNQNWQRHGHRIFAGRPLFSRKAMGIDEIKACYGFRENFVPNEMDIARAETVYRQWVRTNNAQQWTNGTNDGKYDFFKLYFNRFKNFFSRDDTNPMVSIFSERTESKDQENGLNNAIKSASGAHDPGGLGSCAVSDTQTIIGGIVVIVISKTDARKLFSARSPHLWSKQALKDAGNFTPSSQSLMSEWAWVGAVPGAHVKGFVPLNRDQADTVMPKKYVQAALKKIVKESVLEIITPDTAADALEAVGNRLNALNLAQDGQLNLAMNDNPEDRGREPE